MSAAVGHAFPGAVLAVGHGGRLLHLRPSVACPTTAGAAAVAPDTLYDLASLTKVVVTTTIAMTLVDEGALDLDAKVSSFFPAFRGGAKDRVTIRHLLTHSGGSRVVGAALQGHAGQGRLRREDRGDGPRLRAGDEVRLQRPRHHPARRRPRAARGGAVVRGSGPRARARAARDEGRALPPAAGAVAAHRADRERPVARAACCRARSTTRTRSRSAASRRTRASSPRPPTSRGSRRMLLDGGVFEGRRIVSRATVELFTERAGVPSSSRALGWDTPTDESGHRSSVPGEPGYSSAGSLLSPRSFGHTGFTGTSMWMDPERGLLRDPAVEPRAPDAREQRDPRRALARRRRGRARGGRPPVVKRRSFLAASRPSRPRTVSRPRISARRGAALRLARTGSRPRR